MKIRRMQVGVFTDHRCEGAFIQFTEDFEDLDEEVGRYCGHVIGNDTRYIQHNYALLLQPHLVTISCSALIAVY